MWTAATLTTLAPGTPRSCRRECAQRNALGKAVDVFFRGSPRQMATALLKKEDWMDDEIDALRSEIERVGLTAAWMARRERAGPSSASAHLMPFIGVDPSFAPLRSHPRFVAVANRVRRLPATRTRPSEPLVASDP